MGSGEVQEGFLRKLPQAGLIWFPLAPPALHLHFVFNWAPKYTRMKNVSGGQVFRGRAREGVSPKPSRAHSYPDDSVVGGGAFARSHGSKNPRDTLGH
jgi:hypothetical protein